MILQSLNPATGEKIQSYPLMSLVEVEKTLDHVQEDFISWRQTNFKQRALFLKKAVEVMLTKKKEYARLMAVEMGKPIQQGVSEIEKCALGCEYYIEHAENFLKPELVETDAFRSYITYEPLGIVLAIMPWNFPFWQVFRFAAPTLMAGNGVVLKHAANVSGCALAIEKIFQEAGFPKNIFRTLIIDNHQVAAVINHPFIKAVTLTGSTAAGKAVAAQAGQALKKVVLELGGSDPFIVLADADLDKAVEAGVKSRLNNAGQSCIAAKRFIVVDSIRESFENKIVEAMKSIKMGNPLDEKTEMGPLARFDLREVLNRQVQSSVAQGAKIILGGEIPKQTGAYFPPTVLTEVKKGMPAYEEELFGPVAAIIPVKDEKEALFVANDSSFGLGATLFTRDIIHAEQIAVKEIEAGSCFINGVVKSDPRLPFGGIKNSGYGRELSCLGIKEFVNIKTIHITNSR
ncbi:MAG: hypothetical protein ACD_73C00443G0001 [uncultured bacterium]|nr:MAG: hypothetical protein ACD_73C00443G0001 [uncultured bacterium]